MTHPTTLPFHARIDGPRVTAQAGAIAVNAALLLALLAPVVPPMIDAPAPAEPPIVWIRREPPPPVPPVVVPVVTPPRTPAPSPVRSQAVAPPREPPPVVVEGAGEPWVPPPAERMPAGTATASIEPPRPSDGAHLRHRTAPPPPYPREALREGLTGTVLLRVHVDVDGRPLDVAVERSSGHRVLDTAARRQVLARWRFEPAVQDGRAVQAIGLVPVEFRLD